MSELAGGSQGDSLVLSHVLLGPTLELPLKPAAFPAPWCLRLPCSRAQVGEGAHCQPHTEAPQALPLPLPGPANAGGWHGFCKHREACGPASHAPCHWAATLAPPTSPASELKQASSPLVHQLLWLSQTRWLLPHLPGPCLALDSHYLSEHAQVPCEVGVIIFYDWTLPTQRGEVICPRSKPASEAGKRAGTHICPRCACSSRGHAVSSIAPAALTTLWSPYPRGKPELTSRWTDGTTLTPQPPEVREATSCPRQWQ